MGGLKVDRVLVDVPIVVLVRRHLSSHVLMGVDLVLVVELVNVYLCVLSSVDLAVFAFTSSGGHIKLHLV